MIHLNRSIERKDKWTNNEHAMASKQNLHLMPYNNSWKFKRANLVITRVNLQLQSYQNY